MSSDPIRKPKTKSFGHADSDDLAESIEQHLALSRELVELAQELSTAAAEISRMIRHSSRHTSSRYKGIAPPN
jgi:hypothetical protein